MDTTIVRRGKGEGERKPNTTTAKNVPIFILSLSERINYLVCSHHVVQYSEQDLSHAKKEHRTNKVTVSKTRDPVRPIIAVLCCVVHVILCIILVSVLFPVNK